MKACSFTIVGLLGMALFAQTAAARDPWEGQPAYGRALMTRAETNVYWATMKSFETYDEKLAFWFSEMDRMEQRALERGVEPPRRPRYRKPGEKPVPRRQAPYFKDAMAPEEVEQYHAALGGLTTPEERRAFKAEHIVRMRARGFERGLSVPAISGWEYVFENGTPPPDVIP